MKTERKNTNTKFYYKAKIDRQCSDKLLNKCSKEQKRDPNRSVHIWKSDL